MGDRTEGEMRLRASKAQITGGGALQLPVLKDMLLPEGRRQRPEAASRKAPSLKHQGSFKLQASMGGRACGLKLGVSLELGVWSLVFGAMHLELSPTQVKIGTLQNQNVLRS